MLQDDDFPLKPHPFKRVITPLHLACSPACNDTDIVKMLLNKGEDIDAIDPLKRTPICYAITAGNTETMEVLIQSGATIIKTPLNYWLPYEEELICLAIQVGNAGPVKVLAAAGVKVTRGLIDIFSSAPSHSDVSRYIHKCTPAMCSPCVLSVLYTHCGLAAAPTEWKKVMIQQTNLLDSLGYFNEQATSLMACSRKTIYSQIIKCSGAWSCFDYKYLIAVNTLPIPQLIKGYLLKKNTYFRNRPATNWRSTLNSEDMVV